MKDTMQPTPESLTELFKATFNFFQNRLEPSGYDALLQKLAGHCLKYGLEDASCILSLMKFAVQLSLYSPFVTYPKIEWKGMNEYLMEKMQFRKDLATLTSFFRDGENIIIKASMPDGVSKLEIETDGLLQQLAFFSFNTLLAKMNGFNNKKDFFDDNIPILSEYGFKEPYTDKELADIIEYQSARIEEEKTMKGNIERTKIEKPKLGSMVHGFINSGGEVLASIRTTEKYCLIGDMIWELLSPYQKGSLMKKLANGSSPDEEWCALSPNDKLKEVQNWEKSYTRASRKTR